MNLLSHSRALRGALLLGTALAGGGNALAGGTTFIDQPVYEWSFWETDSDGLGGTHNVTHPGPHFPVIDRFDSLTRLSGCGLEWDIDNSGPLALDVTGSVFGPRVTIDLLAPYSRAIDVSSIEVGGFFVVEFTTITSAFDTVQFDSRMRPTAAIRSTRCAAASSRSRA